ncbi:hypothetical protein QN277_028775 [Acacia crassicarpa]|uniref:PGG domain-containing protein n=1 Tax=Acacia crassicarpa TaxID=499986 RepID=A0AAE1J3U7_9FABA|nr:hypothetical protein QN277_028775 [Acacia crassicarpa]
MEESSNFNDIVAEPLTEETKEDWFDGVKNYLISQDLWKVTSKSARPERNRVKDYARWRRKNATALHVMRIACGSRNRPFIRGAAEAKGAWDILYHTYFSPPQSQPPPPSPPPPPPPRPLLRQPPPRPPPPPSHEIVKEMGSLYKAISDNNWPATQAFIDRYPIVLKVEFGALRRETPLHVAVRLGHVGIVEKLVRLVAPEYLEIHDDLGNTPLITAIEQSVVIKIAKCLINKNSKALAIPARRSKREIPVQLAFGAGLKEMGRYLYAVTPSQLFTENLNLSTSVLATCLAFGELGIGLDLLQRCKELLFDGGLTTFSTIEKIALNLPDSLEKSQLPFWKRWVYEYIKIPSTTTSEHFCIDVQQDGENNIAHQGLGLLHRLISSINNLSGMEEICKLKQRHAQATEILNLVCKHVMYLNEGKKAKTKDALFAAARADKGEFLLRVTKANPELVSLVTFPQTKGHIFFDAVRDRRVEIFNLLPSFRFKHEVAKMLGHNSNNLLQVAASLAPPSYLNSISGAALQMQRELQWFKAVESIVNPGDKNVLNNEGLNPLDIFKKNHKELRKKGEEWMKATASSCSVVGTLIVTIMFAVAFTVPGGNDQASGYPIFLENKLFIGFLISDALSLICSTTSVLTFLGILTSRYAEDDFLYSLPGKLIIGLFTLFLSIATMMVAFFVAIFIMLQHNPSLLWAFLPIAMLGGIPIALFVKLQFPLLAEVISSTYGPGILKKKVENWP